MIQKAQWIAPEGGEKHLPCHFRAEKSFDLREIPASVPVQVTCDGSYILEINGIFVGRGPARGTGETAYYDEYEAAQFLHCGENRVTISSVCMNFPAEATLPITPAVRAAIGDIAVTDESWQMALCTQEWRENGPLFTRQSGYAEYRDLNFATAGKIVATTRVPAESKLQKKSVCKRDIPMPVSTPVLPVDIPVAAAVGACDMSDENFAKISTSEPHYTLPASWAEKFSRLACGCETDVTIPAPEAGNDGITLVVDFGKEVSGFVDFELTAPAGTVVDLAYEEELYGDRLRADHSHTNPSYNFAERYTLRAGRQHVGNRFMERGFRMVQITLRCQNSEVTFHNIRATDYRYPFAARGDFFCGDYQLNRLWECAKETISACTTDIFTDCPWRERLFYCNDMFIESRTALKIFGDPRIHRRAFRLIVSQKRQDALFTSCSPAIDYEIPDNGKTDFHIILSGDLTLALALKDYYMHTADGQLVREVAGQLEKMLAQFRSWKNSGGIIEPPQKYWNFIDWSFELNGMGFSGKRTSLLNFLYILAVRAMCFLAEKCGFATACSADEADTMLEQTVKHFYDPASGILYNCDSDPNAGKEYLQALGVPPESACHVTDTSRLAHALARLAGADAAICTAMKDDSLLTPELYYCIFLLDALELDRDPDSALKLIRTHWGKMLDSGTPTLWENGVHMTGKSGFGGSASLCHGFSSAPAAFLQSAILGVTPLEPGFAKFAIAPQTPQVRFASGRVPTPHGSIKLKWQYRDGKFHATVTIPPGCTAEIAAGTFTAGTHTFEF